MATAPRADLWGRSTGAQFDPRDRAAVIPGQDGGATPVSFHDLLDQVKPQSASRGAWTQAVKRLEDTLAFFQWDAGTVILHFERRIRDAYDDVVTAMFDRVLDQVRHYPLERGGITAATCALLHFHLDRPPGGDQQRYEVGDDPSHQRAEIQFLIVPVRVETLDVEELLRQRRQPVHIAGQVARRRVGVDFDLGCEDGDWRPQFVRRRRDEPPLPLIAFVQTAQRIVHGADQWHNLLGNVRLVQTRPRR